MSAPERTRSRVGDLFEVGDRLASVVSTTNVVVVGTSRAPVILECGRHPMRAAGPVSCSATSPTVPAPGARAGATYEDAHSGLRVRCTRAGTGQLTVEGRVMVEVHRSRARSYGPPTERSATSVSTGSGRRQVD